MEVKEIVLVLFPLALPHSLSSSHSFSFFHAFLAGVAKGSRVLVEETQIDDDVVMGTPPREVRKLGARREEEGFFSCLFFFLFLFLPLLPTSVLI